MILEGRVWKFGDEIDTDIIVPARYGALMPEEYKKHIMEPVRPDFFSLIQEGDFIFAGTAFGMGSSRGQAVVTIVEAGIKAIVAVSFGRIFYRSVINEGLPAIVCPDAYFNSDEGDVVRLDIPSGIITNITKGTEFKFYPFTDLALKIVLAGGGINYYKSVHQHE